MTVDPADMPTVSSPAARSPQSPPPSGAAKLLVPFAVGAAVTVALGVYGQMHTPTGVAVNVAGFSSTQAVKAWLVTAAALFALVQLVSALAMYGKLPVSAPSWTGTLHRWSGRAAFLLTVPVALHCLYALGFQSGTPRVLLHSLLGCFFFGAFTAKMLVLQGRGLPGWALPLVGGSVFTALIGLWLTSSFWFFTTVGVTF